MKSRNRHASYSPATECLRAMNCWGVRVWHRESLIIIEVKNSDGFVVERSMFYMVSNIHINTNQMIDSFRSFGCIYLTQYTRMYPKLLYHFSSIYNQQKYAELVNDYRCYAMNDLCIELAITSSSHG